MNEQQMPRSHCLAPQFAKMQIQQAQRRQQRGRFRHKQAFGRSHQVHPSQRPHGPIVGPFAASGFACGPPSHVRRNGPPSHVRRNGPPSHVRRNGPPPHARSGAQNHQNAMKPLIQQRLKNIRLRIRKKRGKIQRLQQKLVQDDITQEKKAHVEKKLVSVRRKRRRLIRQFKETRQAWKKVKAGEQPVFVLNHTRGPIVGKQAGKGKKKSPAMLKKRQAFQQKVKPIRQQFFMHRRRLRELQKQDNQDPVALKEQLQQERKNFFGNKQNKNKDKKNTNKVNGAHRQAFQQKVKPIRQQFLMHRRRLRELQKQDNQDPVALKFHQEKVTALKEQLQQERKNFFGNKQNKDKNNKNNKKKTLNKEKYNHVTTLEQVNALLSKNERDLKWHQKKIQSLKHVQREVDVSEALVKHQAKATHYKQNIRLLKVKQCQLEHVTPVEVAEKQEEDSLVEDCVMVDVTPVEEEEQTPAAVTPQPKEQAQSTTRRNVDRRQNIWQRKLNNRQGLLEKQAKRLEALQKADPVNVALVEKVRNNMAKNQEVIDTLRKKLNA